MNDLAQQTLVENGMLTKLMEGLRTTLAWKVQGNEFSRKLSTLRYMAHTFQGHMERLMALEECGGYMDVIVETNPNLGTAVVALRQEHELFRKGTRTIIHRLDHVSPTDRATFIAICDDLTALLKRLDEHSRKEVDIFQEVFENVGGGEG